MASKGTFMSRGQVKEWLGVTDFQFTKMEAAGAFTGIVLPGLKHKRYKRAEIARLANGRETNEDSKKT